MDRKDELDYFTQFFTICAAKVAFFCLRRSPRRYLPDLIPQPRQVVKEKLLNVSHSLPAVHDPGEEFVGEVAVESTIVDAAAEEGEGLQDDAGVGVEGDVRPGTLGHVGLASLTPMGSVLTF